MSGHRIWFALHSGKKLSLELSSSRFVKLHIFLSFQLIYNETCDRSIKTIFLCIYVFIKRIDQIHETLISLLNFCLLGGRRRHWWCSLQTNANVASPHESSRNCLESRDVAERRSKSSFLLHRRFRLPNTTLQQ